MRIMITQVIQYTLNVDSYEQAEMDAQCVADAVQLLPWREQPKVIDTEMLVLREGE